MIIWNYGLSPFDYKAYTLHFAKIVGHTTNHEPRNFRCMAFFMTLQTMQIFYSNHFNVECISLSLHNRIFFFLTLDQTKSYFSLFKINMLHYTNILRIAKTSFVFKTWSILNKFYFFLNKMPFQILSTYVLPLFFIFCWTVCSASASSKNETCAKEDQESALMEIYNVTITPVVRKLGTDRVKRAFPVQSAGSRWWGWMRPLVYLVIELPSNLLCKVFYILYRIIRILYNEWQLKLFGNPVFYLFIFSWKS